jgi:hypothetical protein
MVAQMRQKQDAGASAFAEKEKAAAGFADLHNADVIFKCKKLTNNKDSVKVVTKTAFGQNKDTVRYVLMLDPTNAASKNRIDQTYQCEILLEKGFGAHNYYALRKMLVLHGYLKENGAWYNFPKEVAEGLNISDKKMYLAPVNEIIKENIDKFVALLKETDCYSVVLKSGGTKEIAGDEDVEEQTVETTYNVDEDDDEE